MAISNNQNDVTLMDESGNSIQYARIQMRRGLESQFDVSKMLPAEFAVTIDTEKVHVAFSPGKTKQLMTVDDALEEVQEKADEILATLPEDYTHLEEKVSSLSADAKKTGDIFDDIFEILKNIGFSVKSSSTKSCSFNFKFYIGDTIVIKNLGVQCNIVGYKTTDGSSVVLASNMYTKNIIVYTFSDNIKAIEIIPLNSDKDINVSFSLSKTTENIWSFCKGLSNYNTDKYVYGNVGVGDQYSFTTNDKNTVSVFYLTSGTSVQINKGYKFIVWAFKKDNPSSTFFLHTNGNIDQTRVYTDDVIYLNNEDYFYGISVKRNDLSEITVEDVKNNLIILDNKKHEYLIGHSYDYGNSDAKISMQLNDNQMFGVSIKPLDDNINMIHLSHGYVAKLIFVENTDKSTAFSVPEDFQQNIYVTEYRKKYEKHSVFLMIKREDGQIMDNNFVVDMYDNKNLNNKTVSEIVIAASNSNDYDKYNSDFICSGNNDEIIINRAINSLDGSGTIYFCDGDYYIDDYYYTKTSEEYTAAFSIGITQNLEYQKWEVF